MTLLSLPIERSGFSVFVGESLNLPDEQAEIRRVLQYILRPTLALKHLHYAESTGVVQYRDPRGPWKSWGHAVDFLADFAQHIPRARQHQVTYAGYFANALGNLKNPNAENPPASSQSATSKRYTRYTRWAALVLRTWALDPELCWQCGKTMLRSRTLFERQELLRLLKNLKLDNYPSRPRSPPPPDGPDMLPDCEFSDDTNQVPPGWDECEAA
jgi:hypothetical protein